MRRAINLHRDTKGGPLSSVALQVVPALGCGRRRIAPGRADLPQSILVAFSLHFRSHLSRKVG